MHVAFKYNRLFSIYVGKVFLYCGLCNMIRSSSQVTRNQKSVSSYKKKRFSSRGKEKSDEVDEARKGASEECDVAQYHSCNTAVSKECEVVKDHKIAEVKSFKYVLFEGKHNSRKSLSALEKWESESIDDRDMEKPDELQDEVESNSSHNSKPEGGHEPAKDLNANADMDMPLSLSSDAKEEESLTQSISEQEPCHEKVCVQRSKSNSISRIVSNLELDCLEEGNSYTEREIYEKQLLQLQEQLVAVMIQEEEKSENLKVLENVQIDVLLKELEEEKQKNSELTENISFMKNKFSSTLQRKNASRRRRKSPNVDVNTANQVQPQQSEGVSGDGQEIVESLEIEDEGFTFLFEEDHYATHLQAEKTEPSTTDSSFYFYTRMIIEMVEDRLWDFVDDDRETTAKEKAEVNALSVKVLKENITRCSNRIQPIVNGIKAVIDIITWASPLTSILTFIVFMIAARHGYLFSLLLLMIVWQLIMNYIHASGIAAKFGLKAEEKEKDSPSDDKAKSNKFQLVLQVAQKVQNELGKIADSMEKINNLLTWQHTVTEPLLIIICVLFVASLFIDGRTMFMFAALAAGVKLLIIKPIFMKYPKVQKRYDRLLSVWNDLPTDAELEVRRSNGVSSPFIRIGNDKPATTPKSATLTKTWTYFCEKMKIPISEFPVPGWEEGQNCTWTSKDKVLTKTKSGKLYLTQSFLCFERCPFESPKNFTIKLEDITSVTKRGGLLPGTGSSIEIEAKVSTKPYVFGGLLTRDELLASLIFTGKAARLPWALEG